MIYLLLFLLALCIVEKLIPRNTNLNFFFRICIFLYIVLLVLYLLGITDFRQIDIDQINTHNIFNPFKMNL